MFGQSMLVSASYLSPKFDGTIQMLQDAKLSKHGGEAGFKFRV